jgi:hypothetical protein
LMLGSSRERREMVWHGLQASMLLQRYGIAARDNTM